VKRIWSLLLCVVAVLVLSPSVQSANPGGIVAVTIDDTIQPISDEFVTRAIDAAAVQNASVVLIEMNTPGGMMSSMEDIISKILGSKVPVIVYVTPSGAHAASAGFFILECADIAAMAPGTNTGAAHPVFYTPWGGKVDVDDVMKMKVENDAAALLRSYVGKRGRNVELAETGVRQSKAWSHQEALDQKLIDVVASSREDLFKQLEGREITRFNGEKITLHLVGQPVKQYEMTLRLNILNWLMDPSILFVLLATGALCIYFEFNHPGAVIPGVIGTIAILLSIFALNLLPTRFMALTLILAAFALFALEAKFATHGVLGIGGVVAMTLGGLLLVDGPIPAMRVQWWAALGVSVPMGLITVFLMSIALKARRNKVVTGAQGMVGEIGVAHTALAPIGKVFVHGELWDAQAPGDIGAGQKIRVTAVRDMSLLVESAEPQLEPAIKSRDDLKPS
jgi:membrane-bound serine protease (ClpP class)